ncbi:MAG: TIGR02206 family membrane protein, partial [Leptospiraceae bacterium]|nr:TIGR02206 family membrane protein [Leptospiraceae bacterium]
MNKRFELWSLDHWLVIFFTVSLLICFVAIGKKDPKSVAANRIGYCLSGILILNSLAYVFYRIFAGYWEIKYDLPMEFCNWSLLATAIALLNHNRTFAEISYFWVMSGSVNGVIFPDLQYEFPHLYFFIFFVNHSGLVISSLYLVFGLGLYPQKGSVIRSFLWLQVYTVSAFLVDFFLKTNYGYLMEKPKSASPLDWLG